MSESALGGIQLQRSDIFVCNHFLQIGKPAVYIGIGYDILGDWLIDETGVVYFQNQIQKTLTPFSQNIYDFLEKDIYRCADLFQKI